jgi:hypothetical protein
MDELDIWAIWTELDRLDQFQHVQIVQLVQIVQPVQLDKILITQEGLIKNKPERLKLQQPRASPWVDLFWSGIFF